MPGFSDRTTSFGPRTRRLFTGFAAALSLAFAGAPAFAQVDEIDPNSAIDADLSPSGTPTTPSYDNSYAPYSTPAQPPAETAYDPAYDSPSSDTSTSNTGANDGAGVPYASPPGAANGEVTYQEDDLIGAAEGVFGKGAEGLAGMIRDILADQGQPNAYITGREGGGAFIFGLRYGSGTLFHRVEGDKPVYWTGPSLGFDAGASAGSTFVLVYNLHDSEALFERFPAGEGAAYLVGGFNASYMRKGDVVLIPIRLGVGARLGVNVGYMKFSHEQDWMPF